MPPRKRGGAKAAGSSRKRKGEEAPEAQPVTQSREEEPEREDRTPVTGEESTLRVEEMTVTGALNSDHSGEKENRNDATDTSPGQRSMGAAHAQTCARAPRTVPLGKPRSGRVWKDRNKQRFSALLRDKPLRSSWQKKMEAKREKELVKQYHQQLKDQKAREKEEKRKRREENLKRREENQRKAEIVQVIRNTSKLKRMKKKQLRKIEKRDTLSVLQKTPPAVKKAGKRE